MFRSTLRMVQGHAQTYRASEGSRPRAQIYRQGRCRSVSIVQKTNWPYDTGDAMYSKPLFHLYTFGEISPTGPSLQGR